AERVWTLAETRSPGLGPVHQSYIDQWSTPGAPVLRYLCRPVIQQHNLEYLRDLDRAVAAARCVTFPAAQARFEAQLSLPPHSMFIPPVDARMVSAIGPFRTNHEPPEYSISPNRAVLGHFSFLTERRL